MKSEPVCLQESEHPRGGAVISVLVRLKNEMHSLPEFWNHIQRQTIFDRTKVICLDSGSVDGSIQYLQTKLCGLYQIDANTFNFGRSANQICSLARTDIVLMISAHVLLQEDDALERVVDFLAKRPLAALYLRQSPNHIFGFSYYDIAYLRHRFPAGNSPVLLNQPASFSNAASAFHRSAWERNPFPELHGSEDHAWVKEHLRLGGTLYYFPGATALHSHAESPNAIYERVRLNVIARNLKGSYGRSLKLFAGVFFSMLRCGAKWNDAFTYAFNHAKAYW